MYSNNQYSILILLMVAMYAWAMTNSLIPYILDLGRSLDLTSDADVVYTLFGNDITYLIVECAIENSISMNYIIYLLLLLSTISTIHPQK